MNAFIRMGSIGIVMRPIPGTVPAFETLGLPPVIKEFTKDREGLFLVTGPTGSGKSTTLASLIDIINRERACHIVTIEDPVEFVHAPVKSIISQREVGRDTKSFSNALKRLPREDPDVVLIGEIRDKESMQAAIEMAETGQLVFATLHTSNAFQTINRVMDFFSEGEKEQMVSQISMVLKGIVSQRLLPRSDGSGFACACEIMRASQAVRNLIRANKVHQINSILDNSKKDGMISMDDALFDLYRNGLVDMEEALSQSSKGAAFQEKLATMESRRPKAASGKERPDALPAGALYVADFSGEKLGDFDASGSLVDASGGLLFKDTGGTGGKTHFVADYSILNGRKEAFRLDSLFRMAYRVDEEEAKKKVYDFSLRIGFAGRKVTEIPVQLGLIGDGEWHTLEVPIPKGDRGKEVRYYMLVFDGALTRVVFAHICFI